MPHVKLSCLLAFFLAFCLPPFSNAAPADPPYDLVIRGGKIVDGTGNPWFLGDIAVRGDRIAAVGQIPELGAKRVIDARGLIAAPGFIDMHSHSDFTLFEDGGAESKIRQGVTTEILGESSSGGPSKGKLRPASARVKGVEATWTTLGGYFTALERAGASVNVASYCGLGSIWRSVMADSFERPTPAQLDQMKALLDEAMMDGALGLSSMLAGPPDMLAATEDVTALCGVVAKHGGIYSSHIRNEGTDVFDAVREAIAIGERAGVPVDIIHIKIADQKLWGRMKEVLGLIEDARKRGVNVQANIYPYTRGNNDLASIVPPWAHEGGREKLLLRLKDTIERAKIKKDVLEGLPGWYNHYLAVGGDWSRMLVSASSLPNKRFEGLTMDKILALRAPKPGSRDALDELFDFLIEENGSVGTIYAHHSEDDMNLALSEAWCSVGSDGYALATEGPLRRGNPHPRSFGTFPRILGVYVRERGLLRLEDAVRKMTSLNALKVRLRDRGLLRAGAFADIVLFDAGKVIDRASYLEPFQYPEGIEYVIVNGALTLEKGKHLGARAGRVLRRGD